MSLQGRVCVSSRGFCSGVCLGCFVWKVSFGVVFVRPLLSEYIHYNRKLTITFNFRFHMYEFFYKCDVTCSWTPSSCHKLSHLPESPTPRARRTLWTLLKVP